MPAKSQLTVAEEKTEETAIANKPKGGGLTRRRKSETSIEQNIPQAQAIALEELNSSLNDEDLVLSIVEYIRQRQDEIKKAVQTNEELAESLEAARLAAVHMGQQRGIQKARANAAAQAQSRNESALANFKSNTLPKLLESTSHLPDESAKQIINQSASMLGLEMIWTVNGEELECDVKFKR